MNILTAEDLNSEAWRMVTLGDLDGAYNHYKMTEINYGKSPSVVRNKAYVLLRMGRVDDAMEEIRRNFEPASVDAEQVGEVDIVMDSILVGDVYRRKGFLDKAIQTYASIISYIDQENMYWDSLHYSVGVCNFRAGRWSLAWEGLEHRGAIFDITPPLGLRDIPRWTGQALTQGTLVIYGEQGRGDAIMMARYFSELSFLKHQVIFLVHNELLSLFRFSFPDLRFDEVLSVKREDISFVLPDMSLPYILGQNLFPEQKYLRNPGTRFVDLDDRNIRRFKVGVAWNGSPKNLMDASRSININVFLRIFDGLNIDLYCLVPREMCVSEGLIVPDHVIVPTTKDDDFGVMADLIASMDLVISVDSAPAHLAGALGVPVWILLASEADWRWRYRFSDWYLSMRIFRQEQAAGANWEGVIAEVRQQLIHLLSETCVDRA